MLVNDIAKLLQEAREMKEALEQIGPGLPAAISAEEIENRINALEATAAELERIDDELPRLANDKWTLAENLSDYIVLVKSVVKNLFGAESPKYEMVAGSQASEQGKAKEKE